MREDALDTLSLGISDSEYDDIAYLSVRMKETTEGGKVCERCICTVM